MYKRQGKYGGPEAFLTGTISRKMHLHARRLIIDEPGEKGRDGGTLDVTAELPEHFATSMESLGFDPGLSDADPDEGPPEPTRAEKKQVARQHAKQVRKNRRGERTRRGAPPSGKPGRSAKADRTGKPRKPGKSGKPGSRPKGPGKPAKGPR